VRAIRCSQLLNSLIVTAPPFSGFWLKPVAFDLHNIRPYTHAYSVRKHLSERHAGESCGRQEAVQTLSVARARRKPRHGGADKISDPIGL
jgi:hypothetical protein